MDFVSIIETLGFPIACVAGLAWFIYNVWMKQITQTQEHFEEIIKSNVAREDRMYQQIDKFNETMNNFNSTLVKIDTRLEILEKTMKYN